MIRTKNKKRYINEDGKIINLNGEIQSLLDFNATKEFIPRYYDYHTSNKAFLNFHVLLKKLGIKNHNEHLQIFDKSLIGVDPRSASLTDQEKAKVLNEIRINPWYYLREVLLFENNIKFRLDIGAFFTLFLMMRSVDFIEELPRQTGKTFTVMTYIGWLMNFGTTDCKLGNVHYKQTEIVKNIKLIIEILDSLPEYLQLHRKSLKSDKEGALKVKDKSQDAANKMDIYCEIYNNELSSFIVGTDKDQANNTGRGRTIPIWVIDEFAHIKFNDIAYNALKPASRAAIERAKMTGKPYGIWCMCTPGDMKTDKGKWCRYFIDNMCMHFGPDHYKIADMTKEEIDEYINKFSRSNIVHLAFEHYLLGYNAEWMTDASKGLVIPKIRSEVMLKWEVNTDNSPFSANTLSVLDTYANINEEKKFTYKLDDEGNSIDYYPTENQPTDFLMYLFTFREHGLVLGIDVAFGGGGESDSSTIVAVDPKTLRVVFTYRRNDIAADHLAMLLWRLIKEFFTEMDVPVALAIERNSNGATVIHMLKRFDDLSRYLVVYPVSDAKMANPTSVSDYAFSYNGSVTKFDIGLQVNETTRAQLMNILIQLVTKYTRAIAYKPISSEVKTVIIKKTTSGKERIEHSQGNHDDVIFGLVHAVYAIMYNTELLKIRNGITVTPDNFMINDNSLSINTTRANVGRVFITYEIKDGKMIDKYLDTRTNEYITRESAERIIAEEKANVLISSEKKEIPDGESLKEQYLPENIYNNVKERYGDENINVSRDHSAPPVESPDSYDLWLSSLL